MLSFTQQRELTRILTIDGFELIEADERQLIFTNDYSVGKMTIKILINLRQPFISITLDKKKLLDEQPDTYYELKKVIDNILNKYFED